METLDFTALENSVYRLKEVVEKYKENEKEFIVTLFNGSSIFCNILQR